MTIYQTLELNNMIMIVRTVFHENNKSYSQIFLDECLCKLQMLYYDVSEGTDDIKTSESKDCDVCHYWYFLDKSFKLQQNVFNGWHDVLSMMSMNLSDIAILNISNTDCGCIISRISKSEPENLLI